jgi:uncharacterized phage protein (TIGR01671 family)
MSDLKYRLSRRPSGLNDKNSKQIYEGDIVRQKARTVSVFIVLFGKFMDMVEGGCANINSYGWYLMNIENQKTMNLLNDEAGYPELNEVIGNIHENPELIMGFNLKQE